MALFNLSPRQKQRFFEVCKEIIARLDQFAERNRKIIAEIDKVRDERVRARGEVEKARAENEGSLSSPKEEDHADLQKNVTADETASKDEDLDSSSEDDSDLKESVFENSGSETVEASAVVPSQGILLKREPANQSDEMKSNASRHSSPQGSPQQSPNRTEAKVTHQSVEHTPVTAAPQLKSGDATGAVTNTVNATDVNVNGTTPTAPTAESRARKLPDDGMPALKMDDSSTRATSAANISIATAAMSFGMTSAQPPSPGNLATTAVTTSPATTDAQLIPIFPVMPAFIISLMAGVNQPTLIPPVDNSSMPLLDRLSNPPGCNPNPPGCNPNPLGCNPVPPGSNPNPPGSNPYPPGCNPNRPG